MYIYVFNVYKFCFLCINILMYKYYFFKVQQPRNYLATHCQFIRMGSRNEKM